ncbi:MAG TPA: ribonuclease P protein component [Polyangiaceae bacterium]|nr:ribonuclease P protein component [Polyangiaceae bacterium]
MAVKAIGRFSAASRVRKRAEFRRVQAQALRVVTRHFVFLLHMNAAAAPSPAPGRRERSTATRLGITASRKVGNAVHRNRAKRLVREAFRATRDLWWPGLDVVVLVKSDLGDMKLDQVVDEWRGASGSLTRVAKQSQKPEARA